MLTLSDIRSFRESARDLRASHPHLLAHAGMIEALCDEVDRYRQDVLDADAAGSVETSAMALRVMANILRADRTA